MLRLSVLPFGLGAAAGALLLRRQLRALQDSRARELRRHAEGQESERRRVAREIHDGPVQELLSLVTTLVAPDDRALGSVRTHVERVVGELRAISEDLHPPTLLPFGLSAAVEAHVGRVQDRHPEVDFELDLYPDGHELPPRVKLAAFRVVQEAVSNAVRHGGAGRVRVEVGLSSSVLRLVVRDGGGGFAPPPDGEVGSATMGGHGLANMRGRADDVGGALRVASSPTGTTVSLDVPLDEGDVGVRRVPARRTRTTLRSR